MGKFLLATSLALTAALGASASVAAGDQRPMRGHFTISLAPTEQRCGANALTLGFEGAGIATHLGRLTGSASNCTEFGLLNEAVDIWDGVATFVAADGSTITTSYEGSQGVPVGGVAAVSSTHTVVAGTGRFDDAAGVWTLVGVVDFAAGSSTGTLAGWLSY